MIKEVDVTITVAYEEEDKEIECICLLESYKGGIGRYDFFGSVGYDEQTNWRMYECLPWEFDEVIDKYIKDNWVNIEDSAIVKI